MRYGEKLIPAAKLGTAISFTKSYFSERMKLSLKDLVE
jgi:hypothetical protein